MSGRRKTGQLPPEEVFSFQLRAMRAPAPEREYRFAAFAAGGTGKGTRKRLAAAGLSDWRFDFAWPAQCIAVEVEGGVWSDGRHVRPAGFTEDCKKYNAAARLGWRVLRYPTSLVNDGTAVRETLDALRSAPEPAPGQHAELKTGG